MPDLLEFMQHRLPWPLIIAGCAGLLAALVALWEVHNWDVFLRFLYQVSYGANDPLYDKDVGFYLFSLPAYLAIKNWMLLTLFLSALLAGTVYWVRGDIEYDPPRRSISPTAIAHGSVLLGCFFAVKAWSYGLDRYLLLYGDNGVVVGAGYTDIHVELPVLRLLIGLAVIAGVHLLGQPARAHVQAADSGRGDPVWNLHRLGGDSSRADPAYLCQAERAAPGEPLHPAQHRYDPACVQSSSGHRRRFPGGTEPHRKDARGQPGHDRQHKAVGLAAADGYVQSDAGDPHLLQVPRRRYRSLLAGRYVSAVMLSARELKSSLLPPNAQTWVNRHVLFTHGNGVVMSPVTRKSPEGLPLFYLRDIPPIATGGPESASRASITARRPTTTSSSRAARRSSIIRRARTTSMRPMTAAAASPSAVSRGKSCSPGTSAT